MSSYLRDTTIARNVIYSEASANSNPRFYKTLYASTPDATTTAETNANDNSVVDTTTKVLATNIIFEKPTSTLVAVTDQTNVQAVLEKITPNLRKIIIGEWAITNAEVGYIISGQTKQSGSGRIVFNPDRTFQLLEGSFTAIRGLTFDFGPQDSSNSGDRNILMFCAYTTNGRYSFFDDSSDFSDNSIKFEFDFEKINIMYPQYAGKFPNQITYPRLVRITKDEIIFEGDAMCPGYSSSRFTVSILKRIK